VTARTPQAPATGTGQAPQAAQAPRFTAGQRVTVARRYPPGHLRTPYYCRGKVGVVERVLPAFLNPEEEGYGLYDRPLVTLYRVRFRQVDLWPGYVGPAHDTVDIEIYEHWLEPV
jgi:nitrile hydratase beta subunit-like protein